MATITIADDDLEAVRDLISERAGELARCPNPAAAGDRIEVGTKMVRKLNQALKRRSGHDCMGDYSLKRITGP